ncbi:MAG: MBL fold metallo-hydrolase, partial [Muribaculaceae bacterium]|nr:MBL fold metallo-hydrolase [Muribaculaceae bacterium]
MSLGSGSSGNSAYLGTRDSGIIIDAGINPKTALPELARNG